MKFIDPHIHLFNLALGDYQWLKPENPPFWSDKSVINHNFTESHLLTSNGIENSGFVHIEAGFNNSQPWKEIQWLESHCKRPFKSIACVDLTLSPEAFSIQIQMLLAYKSVVGCRHILDNCASDILKHKNTAINLEQLAEHQLSFELQMPLNDVNTIKTLCLILKNIPTLSVIINHAGFPPFYTQTSSEDCPNHNEYNNWLLSIQLLSQLNQCAIKCSGWEMTKRQYTTAWCKNIIEQCIYYFGINRVMLSSNFPLCLFSHSYQEVWQNYASLLNELQQPYLPDKKLNQQQLNQLCFENAKTWYKF